jgi:hypothetical protein
MFAQDATADFQRLCKMQKSNQAKHQKILMLRMAMRCATQVERDHLHDQTATAIVDKTDGTTKVQQIQKTTLARWAALLTSSGLSDVSLPVLTLQIGARQRVGQKSKMDRHEPGHTGFTPGGAHHSEPKRASVESGDGGAADSDVVISLDFQAESPSTGTSTNQLSKGNLSASQQSAWKSKLKEIASLKEQLAKKDEEIASMCAAHACHMLSLPMLAL